MSGKPPTQQRRWTSTEQATLKRRHREGRTEAEIATELGRTPGAVASCIRRMRRALGAGAELSPRRGHRKWSARECAEARAMAERGASARTIAAALGRETDAVRRRLHALGVRPGRERGPRPAGPGTRYGPAQPSAAVPANGSGWTAADDRALIKAHRSGAAMKRVADRLGRTPGAAWVRLHQLRRAGAKGVARPRHRRWSRADEQELERLLDEGRGYAEIAKRLRRTRRAVAEHAHRLDWVHPHDSPARPPRSGRAWGPREDATVLRLARSGRSAEAIGTALGRSPGAVRHRLRKLKAAERARAERRAAHRAAMARVAAERALRQRRQGGHGEWGRLKSITTYPECNCV